MSMTEDDWLSLAGRTSTIPVTHRGHNGRNGASPEQASQGTVIPEPLSWMRVDLAPIFDGTWTSPQPEHLQRADGRCLLYAGKVHTFNGEPESLKSWAAQLATLQALQAGHRVLYLDFEDTAESVTKRLSAMGASRDLVLELFDYRRVDEPLSLEAALILDAALLEHPALVILDGVTEAMGLLGLDPYSNPDVAKFWAHLPRRFTRAGATAVLLDHVVKDREARGRWAIGAQHKLAAVDGAAFTFTTIRAFGHGRTGEAKIELAKDRPGHLRGYSPGHTVAHLVLRSDPDGGVAASLTAPEDKGDDWQPTVLMTRMSAYIATHPGLPKTAVKDASKGDTNMKRLALELLITEGYVELDKGPHGALLCRSVRVYGAEEPAPEDLGDF